MEQQQLKRAVRDLLKRNSVTYSDIAQRLGVTHNYIYKLLNDHAQQRTVTVRHVALIVEALAPQVDAHALLLSAIATDDACCVSEDQACDQSHESEASDAASEAVCDSQMLADDSDAES